MFESILIATLVAAGIIIIVGLITYGVIKEKLKNRDFFKAVITKKTKKGGVPTITINIEDVYENSIDELKLASFDGFADDVKLHEIFYKNELQ